MSTKAIREAVEAFAREATFPESPRARKAADALRQLEAVEKAARVIAAAESGGTYSETERAEANALMERIARESGQ